jgi:hypothetical protein
MAFTVKTTMTAGIPSSPWVQITDAVIRIRLSAGEVLVEVADDANGTNRNTISNEAPTSATGTFRAPVREYIAAETGAFYRLCAVSAGAAGDLSSGVM